MSVGRFAIRSEWRFEERRSGGQDRGVRILIVEDEADLAEAVARGIRRRGHGVDVAATIVMAEQKLASAEYDLVIMDWGLPDGEGVELCRRIKTGGAATFLDSRPRVLMLTARDGLGDRVGGLDAGADDYLVKPFAFVELEARVRALLRRGFEGGAPILDVAGVTLDPSRFIVERDGLALDLTVKEFVVLEFFLMNADIVLSQETLLEHCWDEMADPFTNTVRVTVSNLRKKLGKPPLIETIPGRGYVLRAALPRG